MFLYLFKSFLGDRVEKWVNVNDNKGIKVLAVSINESSSCFNSFLSISLQPKYQYRNKNVFKKSVFIENYISFV